LKIVKNALNNDEGPSGQRNHDKDLQNTSSNVTDNDRSASELLP